MPGIDTVAQIDMLGGLMAGGATQASAASMEMARSMNTATGSIEHFLRASGGLLGSLSAVPHRFASAADAGREYRKVLYDIGIYTQSSTGSLNELSRSLMELANKTRISVSVLAELSANVAENSEISSINVKSLQEITSTIEKAYGTVSREKISKFVDIQSSYPELLKKIKKGLPTEELHKFINEIYLLKGVSAAREVESLYDQIQGGAEKIDKSFIFSQERMSAWETKVHSSVTNFGKDFSQLHPIVTDSLKGIVTAGEIYLSTFFFRKMSKENLTMRSDFIRTGDVIKNVMFGPRRTSVEMGMSGAGASMAGGNMVPVVVDQGRNLMGGILPGIAVGLGVGYGGHSAYKALGGSESKGVGEMWQGIGSIVGGGVMAIKVPMLGIPTMIGGVLQTAQGYHDWKDEKVKALIKPTAEMLENPDVQERMLKSQAKGKAAYYGLTPEEHVKIQGLRMDKKTKTAADEIFSPLQKPVSEVEKLTAIEELNRIYTANTVLLQQALQSHYQMVSTQKVMGVGAKDINAEYKKMELLANKTAEAAHTAYIKTQQLGDENMPKVIAAKALWMKEEETAMAVRIDGLNYEKSVSQSQVGLYESQLGYVKAIGGFTSDHLDLLQAEEKSLGDALSKQEKITKEIEARGNKEESAALNQSRMEENRLKTQQKIIELQRKISAPFEKPEAEIRRNVTLLNNQMAMASLLQVPYTFMMDAQMALTKEANKQLEIDKTILANLKAESDANQALSKDKRLGKKDEILLQNQIWEQEKKVSQSQLAYVQSIAYARRGWLEGFTSGYLGGAPTDNASRTKGISKFMLEGSQGAWEEGSIVGNIPISEFDPVLLKEYGITDPNKRKLTKTWQEDQNARWGSTDKQKAEYRAPAEIQTSDIMKKGITATASGTSNLVDILKGVSSTGRALDVNITGSAIPIGGVTGTPSVVGSSNNDIYKQIETAKEQKERETGVATQKGVSSTGKALDVNITGSVIPIGGVVPGVSSAVESSNNAIIQTNAVSSGGMTSVEYGAYLDECKKSGITPILRPPQEYNHVSTANNVPGVVSGAISSATAGVETGAIDWSTVPKNVLPKLLEMKAKRDREVEVYGHVLPKMGYGESSFFKEFLTDEQKKKYREQSEKYGQSETPWGTKIDSWAINRQQYWSEGEVKKRKAARQREIERLDIELNTSRESSNSRNTGSGNLAKAGGTVIIKVMDGLEFKGKIQEWAGETFRA